MRNLLFPALLALALSWQPLNAAAVFRQGEGWTAESEDSGTPESSAVAQMRKAESLEAEGELGKAIGAYRSLVRKFPEAVMASKAQWKVAELYEQQGNYDKAFDAYSAYIKKYPRSANFNKAVEAEFGIAKMFLEGERKRLLGVKTFPSMIRAQEMFEAILKDAPFSKLAPLAQFNVGLALEKQGKPEEAVAAYQKLIEKYAGTPVVADAYYQIGYVYYQQVSRGSYDEATRNKASEAFDEFIARYPESEKVPQARENLQNLSGGINSNTLEVARFYEKQKNYKAAVIYYNEVIRNEAGSPNAELAKNRIDFLKNTVGEEALRGPERTETGARVQARRGMQAQVDTVSRPDYVGPTVTMPEPPPAPQPKMRTSVNDIEPVTDVPAVEPPLPQ